MAGYTTTNLWDSGARTIASFSGDGEFSFDTGSTFPVGVVCGLNSVDDNAGKEDIDFGFYINSKRYQVIESGVTKTVTENYSAGNTFKITRNAGEIRYYVAGSLVYTSSQTSRGTVFGDSSLYSYGDSIYDATIIDYSSAPPVDGFDGGVLQFKVAVHGSDAQPNYGFIGLGVDLTGELADINKGDLAVGQVSVKGSDSDANWGWLAVGQVSVSGTDAEIVPDYNGGYLAVGRVSVFGGESWKETNGSALLLAVAVHGSDADSNWGYIPVGQVSVTASSMARNWGYMLTPRWFAANYEYSELDHEIDPFTMEGVQTVLVSEVDAYLDEFEIEASSIVDSSVLDVVIDDFTVEAGTGASLSATLDDFTISSTGTTQPVGRVDQEIAEFTLEARMLPGYEGLLDVYVGDFTMEAHGAGTFDFYLDEFTAGGTVSTVELGRFDVKIADFTISASSLDGWIADCDSALGDFSCSANMLSGAMLSGNMVLGAFTIDASSGTIASSEVTYAINTNTGAVTKLTLGSFDKLVTAHGKLYGLSGTTLKHLGGTVDGVSTAIPASVRTHSSTLGSNELKRVHSLHLLMRENNGVTLDLIQDERVAYRYKTVSARNRGFGPTRVKVGGGIKFHTAGFVFRNVSGGSFNIGGLEIVANPIVWSVK